MYYIYTYTYIYTYNIYIYIYMYINTYDCDIYGCGYYYVQKTSAVES